MRILTTVLLILFSTSLSSNLLGQTEKKRAAGEESVVQEVRTSAHVTYRRLNATSESPRDARVQRLLERLWGVAERSDRPRESEARLDPAGTERLPFGLVAREHLSLADDFVTVRVEEDGTFSTVCSPLTVVRELFSEEEEGAGDE